MIKYYFYFNNVIDFFKCIFWMFFFDGGFYFMRKYKVIRLVFGFFGFLIENKNEFVIYGLIENVFF